MKAAQPRGDKAIVLRRKVSIQAMLLLAATPAVILWSAGCSTTHRAGAPPLQGIVGRRDLDSAVHVTGLAVGPAGDVWLATLNYGSGPSGIIRIQANGIVQKFTRPESFNRIAVDARGIAWSTVGTGASHQQPILLRIDGLGNMHAYPLPVEGNFIGVAIGPDGAPWFVDAESSAIGRISSDGNITYYGPASSDPTEIVAGNDGDLWFSEPNGNRIGRLSSDGTLNEFALPTAASRPTALAQGADGIWFCESSADRIGRVTHDGHFTEIRVPTADAWPAGIAGARDGTVWFTELEAGKVGRVTRNGVITEYAMPGGGYPGAIARAPDGSLWIASNAKRDAVLGLTTSRSHLVHFIPGR
jgi:virginiamycin B lyase